MVQLNRTFSNYSFTGEARCAGCLCTRSGWFKHVEPPRTFSNHRLAEPARCVEVVQARRRTSSNLLEPEHCRDGKVCLVGVWSSLKPSLTTLLLSHKFRVVRLYRTFSNFSFTGAARCAGCFCTSSGFSNYLVLRNSPSTKNEVVREGSVQSYYAALR